MKLCDIVQFYSPKSGGVQRYVRDKARCFAAFEQIEHQIIVPAAQDGQERWSGSTVHALRSPRLPGSHSYRLLLSRQRILDLLRASRPDLIEVDNPYVSAWTALRAKEELGIPVVAFYHSDYPRALGRTLRRFTGATIANGLSSPLRRYVVKLYNRMDATLVASRRMEGVLRDCGVRNVVRIPLGTDVERFRPAPDAAQLRTELGLTDDDFLLLFVGRLAREKNIASLLRMMPLLRADPGGPGRCHLLLVGDGEQRDLVRSHVREDGQVTWRHYCTSIEELNRYYTAADVFVHAGDHETFGLTSLEAQACGTRVIAVEGGGIDDTVEGEPQRILARSADPVDLAAAVRAVRALPPDADRQARRARIVEQFSLQRSVAGLLQLYRHLLSTASVEGFRLAPPAAVERYADSTLHSG